MERHIKGLDGLRAIAVLAVLLFHAAPGGPVRGGFLGVDLFFVLSGFLITGVLARKPDLRTFYWHRLWRLGPALLLSLAVYLLVAPFVWPGEPHGRDALLVAAYVGNIAVSLAGIPQHISHSWSLAVEEQFYLVWPFLLPLLLRNRHPLLWLVIAIGVLTVWRFSFADEGWRSYYYRTDTRLTGLLLGAMLYFLKEQVRLPASAFWAGAILFGSLLFTADILDAARFIPLAELAALLMIGAVANGHAPALLESRLPVAIGQRSYAIYLWHYPFAVAFRDQGFVVAASASLAVALPMAAMSYATVERWGRAMKRRSPAEVAAFVRRTLRPRDKVAPPAT